MTLSMRMGLRNLARQPRRTVLTALMLILGTALTVWMNGISQGTYAIFIDGATRGVLGHFQVLKGDFNDKPSLFKTVDDPEPIRDRMAGVQGVQGVTTRVESAGLLALGNRTLGVAVLGVDPLREPLTTKLATIVKIGQWFASSGQGLKASAPSIIIGKNVAKRLKADLGSELSFVGQAADGSIAAELFNVVGLLDSGVAELDGSLVLISLRDAQELFALGGRVHRIIGTVESGSDLAPILARLPRPVGYRLESWSDLNPGLHQSIKADRDSGQIMLWVVMLMAILGVANALLMSVFERTREIGIMRALGTSRAFVLRVILWEVAWLSLGGILLGAAIGSALTSWLVIPLSEPMVFGGVAVDRMVGRHTFFGSVITPIMIFTACLAAGLWPATRATRLNPLIALRSG